MHRLPAILRGNANGTQWIRIPGKDQLFNIHFKDFVEGIGNIRAFAHMFQGSVPWDRVMEAQRDVGYDGYLIAEVPPNRFAPEGIRDISQRIGILMGQS